eukprot:11155491-Lingulodinium_polyedra.AAC.1
MGRLAFGRVRAAESLGVGFAPGRPAAHVARGCLGAAKRKARRLQHLRRGGGKPARVWAAGPL